MKRHLIIYMLLGLSLSANAQKDRFDTLYRGPMRFVPGSAVLQTDPATGMPFQSTGSAFIDIPDEESYYHGNGNDGQYASKKSTTTRGRKTETTRPRGDLHASVDISVVAGFGKNAPKGAGFAQNVNVWYSTSLGRHVWLTAGGYLGHLNWDGINATNAGLYGELGYQFDEHWAAYVYGQKSLVNNGCYGYYGYPYYCGNPYYYGYNDYYGCNPFGDKLGAAVRWTPNKSFSMELSVEKDWLPKPTYGYNRRYDYQK